MKKLHNLRIIIKLVVTTPLTTIALLMSADEKELSHKSFDNTPTGIQSLLDWIAGYHLSLSKLLFCAENMGSYVTELSVSSVSMGFSLALVCPLTIKKSIGLQRGKNDRIDAKRIANYAVLDSRKLRLPHLNILQVFPYGEKRKLLHWLTKK